jgi:1-phosphatidylinositol-3-phosphate 5-kinase
MSAVPVPPGRAPAEEHYSLTTFGNPFDEEEADNSSYALVSSLLSKVKSTFTSASTHPAPAGAVPSSSTTPLPPPTSNSAPEPTKLPPSKPVHPRVQNVRERPTAALAASRRPAPPLVSMTPAVSELPSYLYESDSPKSKSGDLVNLSMADHEASTSIPGFPIHDDARSIRTSNSLKRFGSASKVIRRLRGDGSFLSSSTQVLR